MPLKTVQWVGVQWHKENNIIRIQIYKDIIQNFSLQKKQIVEIYFVGKNITVIFGGVELW